jgi:ubiquinone biosynthesis protein UbiJ
MTSLEHLDRSLLIGPQWLLNRSIRASSAATELLASLAGETLAVEVEGLALSLRLTAHAEGIELTTRSDIPAAVTVSGTPLDLLRLLGTDPLASLHASQARIEGHLELAQKFADLLRLGRPDIEEELSGFMGDAPAHALAQAFAGMRHRASESFLAVMESCSEYLQEEGRELPSPFEVQAFVLEVERLRDDVERLAARIERLSAGARGAR